MTTVYEVAWDLLKAQNVPWVQEHPSEALMVIAGLVGVIDSQAKRALSGLTWAEKAALSVLLEVVPKDEFLVVKGREIASRAGVSPSTTTAMLRKLRAADLVEARPLGTRGTWVTVSDRLRLAAAN